MASIHQQEGHPADALPHIQEAVAIFSETGSRHLIEAERTLQTIQTTKTQMLSEQENS